MFGEMNLQADEMTTEVMENAANAATKRREMRRRKILADPNERMRKLTGHNNIVQEPSQMNPNEFTQGLNTMNQSQFTRTSPEFNQQQDIFNTFDGLRHREPDVFAERQPRPGQMGFNNFANSTTNTTLSSQHQIVDDHRLPSKGFMRARHFLCITLGVMIRISLMYSFGRRFVQSIINPFVFLEIAIVGYMRAVGMQFGGNMRGGLWLSTLLLSGVKNDVIQSYKSIVGTITAAVDDFTLYFFAFVFSHLICLLFE